MNKCISMAKCGETLFGEEWACKNSVRLSMYDHPIETIEYIWVNIWCMLDWVLSQKYRNTFSLHTIDQLVRRSCCGWQE